MRLPIAAFLLLVGAFIGWGIAHRIGDPALDPRGPAPDVATIASASLRSVHAQARLTSFAARFVVVVTSEHRTLGLAQTKTMIVPGLIRYELDWSKLHEADLKWNAAQRTLLVEAPAIELAGPQIELTHITEFEQGKLLMALTGSEPALDAANRARVGRADAKRGARAHIGCHGARCDARGGGAQLRAAACRRGDHGEGGGAVSGRSHEEGRVTINFNPLRGGPVVDLRAEIDRLRRERNAVILAHYYQKPEIQDLADFVGDSLDLSRKAAATRGRRDRVLRREIHGRGREDLVAAEGRRAARSGCWVLARGLVARRPSSRRSARRTRIISR